MAPHAHFEICFRKEILYILTMDPDAYFCILLRRIGKEIQYIPTVAPNTYSLLGFDKEVEYIQTKSPNTTFE